MPVVLPFLIRTVNNDTYVDPFASTFVNGGTWDRAGDITVTADGYGTLMLPNATITNVLRVKVSEDYGDSYSGTELYHYNTDIYMFYKPGIHIPVLSLTHYVQGSTTVDYGNYLDDASLGVQNPNLAEISVYPNPAGNEVFINWNGHGANLNQIQVFDVSGKLMFSANTKVNSIALEDFESGVYFIHIWEGDNREIRKFIKN